MWLDSRVLLAALHFNANSDRKQARNAKGDLQVKINFRKGQKGRYTVQQKKEAATFGLCY
jgi:hypothetical protein